MRRRLTAAGRFLMRLELPGLAALVVALLAAFVFVDLADDVLERKTKTTEERMLRALRDPQDPWRPIGPPWMEEFGRDLTALGGVAVLVMVTFGVCGYLWLDRKPAMALSVGIAVTGGLLAGMLLKTLFQRPRPAVVPHLSIVSSTSFPSGHSMMSAVVYLTVALLVATVVPRRALKVYVLACAAGVTLLVGASRVYVGVH